MPVLFSGLGRPSTSALANNNMKLYLPLILVFLFSVVSCSKESKILDSALIEWSRSSDVVSRKTAASYSCGVVGDQWIVISTAYQVESESHVMYTGGEILKSGFFVYPGGIKVNNIQEAIDEAKRIEASR
jgi:hypothetical protein